MSKKISYDTTNISALVSACENATNELDAAKNLVLQVRSHNDWTCREKDAIDEMMTKLRKIIQTTQESQGSFYKGVKKVAEKLTGSENTIKNLFGDVDRWIGNVLAIPVWTNTIGKSVQSVIDKIKSKKSDSSASSEDKKTDSVSDRISETAPTVGVGDLFGDEYHPEKPGYSDNKSSYASKEAIKEAYGVSDEYIRNNSYMGGWNVYINMPDGSRVSYSTDPHIISAATMLEEVSPSVTSKAADVLTDSLQVCNFADVALNSTNTTTE